MLRTWLIATLLALPVPALAEIKLKPYEFKTGDTRSVQAEWGEFEVPARHDEPEKGAMTLAFVRFPSTNPKPGFPIVYLAGGPGGSGIGTARGARFDLFMALREVADVIALDQRGTGASNRPPGCRGPSAFPIETPLLRENWLNYARDVARFCEKHWQEQGVDLAAYTTWESARDLELLRRALGVEKLNLWGISYGTHLALATISHMEDHIHRVVLASPEGLDQTVKMPAHADRYFERVQAAVNADPQAAKRYPNLVATMRKVLSDLDREPATVALSLGQGTEPFQITFDSTIIRFFTAFQLTKNPSNVAQLPATYAALASGQLDQIAMGAYQMAYAQPLGLSAMSTAMDIASGISPERLEQVQAQSESALLGDFMNYPMPHFVGVLESVPDLGETFRQPLSTSVPALILTGTLDGRTFPEAHAEVLSQFKNGKQLVIENAGHDLFMVDPAVTEVVREFLIDGSLTTERIELPPPAFL
ncbi:MAG: alpha/beta fold hydrolase [Pseudomonadota bacterium]